MEELIAPVVLIAAWSPGTLLIAVAAGLGLAACLRSARPFALGALLVGVVHG